MKLDRLEFLKTLGTPQLDALGAIRRLGQCTRQEIGHLFNWSAPSVSKVLKPLQDEGLLLGETIARQERGRRQANLSLNPDWLYALGVNVGFSRLSLAIINLGGKIVARTPQYSLRGLEPSVIIERIHEEGEALQAAHPETPIAGLGVAISGITHDPNDMSRNFPDTIPWRHVPLADQLTALEHHPVVIGNDTVAALLAEMRYGRALRGRDVLYLFMDEGMSLGILSNGAIHLGHNRYSGEFGHIRVIKDGPFCHCGGTGCLESVASTWAMIREMEGLIERGVHIGFEGDDGLASNRPITLEMISEAARQGVPVARNLLGRAGESIGGLLANMINLFDPEKVILAGKLSQEQAHPHLIQTLRESCMSQLLYSRYNPIEVQLSPLGAEASLIGAGSLVFEHFLPACPVQLDPGRATKAVLEGEEDEPELEECETASDVAP